MYFHLIMSFRCFTNDHILHNVDVKSNNKTIFIISGYVRVWWSERRSAADNRLWLKWAVANENSSAISRIQRVKRLIWAWQQTLGRLWGDLQWITVNYLWCSTVRFKLRLKQQRWDLSMTEIVFPPGPLGDFSHRQSELPTVLCQGGHQIPYMNRENKLERFVHHV